MRRYFAPQDGIGIFDRPSEVGAPGDWSPAHDSKKRATDRTMVRPVSSGRTYRRLLTPGLNRRANQGRATYSTAEPFLQGHCSSWVAIVVSLPDTEPVYHDVSLSPSDSDKPGQDAWSVLAPTSRSESRLGWLVSPEEECERFCGPSPWGWKEEGPLGSYTSLLKVAGTGSAP